LSPTPRTVSRHKKDAQRAVNDENWDEEAMENQYARATCCTNLKEKGREHWQDLLSLLCPPAKKEGWFEVVEHAEEKVVGGKRYVRPTFSRFVLHEHVLLCCVWAHSYYPQPNFVWTRPLRVLVFLAYVLFNFVVALFVTYAFFSDDKANPANDDGGGDVADDDDPNLFLAARIILNVVFVLPTAFALKRLIKLATVQRKFPLCRKLVGLPVIAILLGVIAALTYHLTTSSELTQRDGGVASIFVAFLISFLIGLAIGFPKAWFMYQCYYSHVLLSQYDRLVPDNLTGKAVGSASALVTFFRVLCTLRTQPSQSICNMQLHNRRKSAQRRSRSATSGGDGSRRVRRTRHCYSKSTAATRSGDRAALHCCRQLRCRPSPSKM
jgi:hypothetical protein